MSSRSVASCLVLVAACCTNGCSTYGTELLGGALGSAGTGGADVARAGAGAGGEGNGAAVGDAGASGDIGVAGAEDPGAGGASAGKGGAGDGGTPGGGAGGSTAGSGGAVVVDPNLIDDLEDNTKNILYVSSPRRDGIWDINNDLTVGAVQTPPVGDFSHTALAPTDRPYPADAFAAYTKGSGFTNYGAYMNVSMRSFAVYANTPVYDASGYKGISFLAKVGDGATKSMRVRFVSSDTDPRGKLCKLSTDTPTPTQDQLCYNHYFADATLTTAWATYVLDFDQFMQGVDGMQNPTINLAGMFGLEFYFDKNTVFEVWIDDLKFVK